MSNNDTLHLTGALEQSKSRQQINADLKQLEKIIRLLYLTGTFARGNTKKELNTSIQSLQSQLNHVKLAAKIDGRNVKKEIDRALSGMSFKEIDALDIDADKAKLKIRKVIADIKAYAEKMPVTVNLEAKKSRLNHALTSYLEKNTKINESAALRGEAEQIRGMIDAAVDQKAVDQAADALRLYESEVSAAGFAAISTEDRLKNLFGYIRKIGDAFGVTSLMVNNFVKALKALRTNDTILTEISKLSELTGQQRKELEAEAFQIAGRYGQSSSDYLLTVQELARTGYANLSKELAELSLLAQTVGNMTAENANDYLLAADAAYRYGGSVERLSAALDGAYSVSGRSRISLTDLAEAVRVSASYAAEAGVEISELTAAAAAMLAATGRSGSEIGRAFEGIVSNLRQADGLFDGADTLREPMDALRELAGIYNSLPDDSEKKQKLLSDLGGTDYADALAGLLERWDMYEQMLGAFSQGAGSVLADAERSADSWEGRLHSLSNSFDSFVSTLTRRDVVLGGISLFDGMIQGAETLTGLVGEITVAAAAMNTVMTAANKDYGIRQIWNREKGSIDVQGNLFGVDITAVKQQKQHFEEAKEAIAGWNGALFKGSTDINDFKDAVVQNNAQLKAYLSSCSKDAPASLAGYKAYLNAAGISTDALRLKTVLMNAAIGMGIGAAIQLAVTGITALIQAEENLRQATAEAADAYRESASSIDDYVTKYQELREQLLAAKGNEQLTYDIKKQMLELQTELNETYGKEYGYLNLVTDAYKDQTDAIKNLNKAEAEKFLKKNHKGIEDAEKKKDSVYIYHLGKTDGLVRTEEFDLQNKIKEIGEANGIYYTEMGLEFIGSVEDASQAIYNFMSEVTSLQENSGEISGSMNKIFNQILNTSGDALSRAEETIDSYQKIYTQAQMARIAADDGLSKGYENAVSAVEAYNEAVLKSEDPYHDKNVKDAWEHLQTIKEEIRENETEWGAYSEIMDQVFAGANDNVYSFYRALRDDSAVSGLAKELKGLSDTDLWAMEDDGDNGDVFDKLRTKAKESGVEVQNLIDLLVMLGYVQGKVGNSAPETESPVSVSSLTEDQSKRIDDFQASVSRLQEVRRKFRAGELSDDPNAMLDLFQEFPELERETDNLANAIQRLIDGRLEELLKYLENPSPELHDQLQEIADSADSVDGAMSTAIATYDQLQKVREEITGVGSISNNTVNSLMAKYPRMQELLIDYLNHRASEEDILNALQEQYLADETNYKLAAVNKMQNNTAFMNHVKETHQSFFNGLAETYALDVNNWTTLAQAKADIDSRLIQSLSQSWAKYFRLIKVGNEYAAEETASYKNAVADFGVDTDKKTTSGLSTAKSQANAYAAEVNQILADLENAAANEINFSGTSASSAAGNSAGPAKEIKETAQTFNWIDKKLETAAKATEKLAKAFDRAFGISGAREKYKTYLAQIESEISANETAAKFYQDRLQQIGLSYEWIAKIKSGDFSVDSITDETLKTQISEYQTYANKLTSCYDTLESLEEKRLQAAVNYAEKEIAAHEKEIAAVDKLIERRKALVALKELFHVSASKADLSYQQKKYETELDMLEEQNRKLLELMRTTTYGDEAWQKYNEQMIKNTDTAANLVQTIAELAVELANLPLDKYEKFVDDTAKKDDLYSAKEDNAVNAKDKNKYIDRQIANAKDRDKKAQSTAKETGKNVDKSVKDIEKAKGKDYSSTKVVTGELGPTEQVRKKLNDYYDKVNKYTKSKKKIPESLITEIAGEGYAELAKSCLNYNAALAADNTAQQTAALSKEQTKQEIAAFTKQKFDNIADQYDRKTYEQEQKQNKIKNQIAAKEAKGQKASVSDYEALIKNEKEQQKIQSEKAAALQKNLDKAVADGTVKKGSEQWNAMVDAINDAKNAGAEAAQTILEYQNTIRQIKWDAFDSAMETVKRTNREADYYINLLSRKKLVDDETGSYTEHGTAALSLYKQNYDSYRAQADAYQKEYDDIRQKIRTGELSAKDEAVIQRQRELQDAYRDAALSAEDELEAIQDLVRQGYDAQLDTLGKLIGRYKELKNSAADAYGYQKQVADKVKTIAALQKQLTVLKTGGAEETRAQIQKLKTELQDAKEDLRDTQYERYISDAEEMLDDLLADYEEYIDEKLNDTNNLLGEISGLLGSGGAIVATLKELDGSLTDSLAALVNGSTTAEKQTDQTVAKEKKEVDKPTKKPAAETAKPTAETGRRSAEMELKKSTEKSVDEKAAAYLNAASEEKAQALVRSGEALIVDENMRKLLEQAAQKPILLGGGIRPELPPLPSPPAFLENAGENIRVEIGDIVMNGVNDAETFGRQLREEICRNGKTTQCIAEAVSAKQLGRGIGSARLHR